MNDSSASLPGMSLLPDSIAAITTIHFVLMALVALAAIAIIVVGSRRKHQRKVAARQVEERAADAGVTATASERVEAQEVPGEPEAPAAVERTAAPVAPQPPVVESETAAVPPPPPAPDPAPLADQPIAAAAPMDASPASLAADAPAQPAPAQAPPAEHPADGSIAQLKGLGPKLVERLAGHGITTVGQMAALTDDQASALDAQLGPFTGRMARDRWIEQSRFLAAGDRAGFEAVFGRL